MQRVGLMSAGLLLAGGSAWQARAQGLRPGAGNKIVIRNVSIARRQVAANSHTPISLIVSGPDVAGAEVGTARNALVGESPASALDPGRGGKFSGKLTAPDNPYKRPVEARVVLVVHRTGGADVTFNLGSITVKPRPGDVPPPPPP